MLNIFILMRFDCVCVCVYICYISGFVPEWNDIIFSFQSYCIVLKLISKEKFFTKDFFLFKTCFVFFVLVSYVNLLFSKPWQKQSQNCMLDFHTRIEKSWKLMYCLCDKYFSHPFPRFSLSKYLCNFHLCYLVNRNLWIQIKPFENSKQMQNMYLVGKHAFKSISFFFCTLSIMRNLS